MDVRPLLFLLILATGWCCNARVVITQLSLVQNEITPVLQDMNYQQQDMEVEVAEEFGNHPFCPLCKKIAKPILAFLSNHNNQKIITTALQKICPYTFSLKIKCTMLVNYLPVFFTQVALATPKAVCVSIKLCSLIGPKQYVSEDYHCDSCHEFVADFLLALKDPNTQHETIQILLEACDYVEGFDGITETCKGVVSHILPLILDNAELLLGRFDVCSMSQACSSAINATVDGTPMLSANRIEENI